jgi:hypothetical protein
VVPHQPIMRSSEPCQGLSARAIHEFEEESYVPSPGKRLICKEVPGWPKLAWAAAMELGSGTVSVRHGPWVETHSDWCVEAVWAGDFSAGDFDLTDVVAGTGVRVRDDHVVFVSSGDTLNRLHHFQDSEILYVSNSLPALMAVAETALLPDYDYTLAMESIIKGLISYVREIPSTRGPIHLTYFHNLVVTNSKITVVAKPSSAPDFTDFATYRDYLFACARRVGANARAPGRRHDIRLLATVSSGYDSPAAAVLAREAGAREAVTIAQAFRARTHVFGLNDSGAAVARQLGMTCEIYSRTQENYPFEDCIWASMGSVGDVNLTIFDYGEKPCLLFTGFIGDVLWDKDTHQIEPLHRKDPSGARFSEGRLELGVFNCSPVFWGCQKESEIYALSRRAEMLPWTLGTNYDRPIPRRLIEEAGVTRGSFGTRKRLTSFSRLYGRPLSANLREDFTEFMERRNERVISQILEALSLVLRGIDFLVLKKLPNVVRFSCREWVSLPSPSVFFIWANERRRDRYFVSLQEANLDEVTADSLSDGAGL